MKSKGLKKIVSITAGILSIFAGVYLLILFFAPTLPNIPLNTSPYIYRTSDDSVDTQNRIQIPKINLELPYFSGGPESLERGAWHRVPERGNPADGGNFVLAAHRLEIGWTPGQTERKSPFYSIDKLNSGDEIVVFYNQNRYKYKITKIYEVEPSAINIENESNEPKMTIYTCTLKGAADGRVVLEAQPI